MIDECNSVKVKTCTFYRKRRGEVTKDQTLWFEPLRLSSVLLHEQPLDFVHWPVYLMQLAARPRVTVSLRLRTSTPSCYALLSI